VNYSIEDSLIYVSVKRRDRCELKDSDTVAKRRMEKAMTLLLVKIFFLFSQVMFY